MGHGGWGHGGGMGRGGGWGHGGWGRGVGRGWDRGGFSHRGIFGQPRGVELVVMSHHARGDDQPGLTGKF